MLVDEAETEDLLDPAAAGDEIALGRLLDRYRDRLRRMIAARLDRRLTARLDPSDVVQDALADAGRKLLRYARERPCPSTPGSGASSPSGWPRLTDGTWAWPVGRSASNRPPRRCQPTPRTTR